MKLESEKKKPPEDINVKKVPVVSKVLASAGKDVSESPFLKALAEREEVVRSGKLAVIYYKYSIVNGFLVYNIYS